MLEHVI